MDPDPWELSTLSRLVLLAYCLFQMLWSKLNFLLLCIAVTMTHLSSMYLTALVGFFSVVWQRRLEAGRRLIRLLCQKFPVEQLVPSYILWDALCIERTWALGILCLVFSSARLNVQRLLSQLSNELGKALHHATRWTHCGLAIACQNAYQVMLRAVIFQLLATLLLGCSERLWAAVSQREETTRACQFMEHSMQQHPRSRSFKEMNQVPSRSSLGRRTRLKQNLRRPNFRTRSSTFCIPAPHVRTGTGNCHCLTLGVPLNTRFHESNKKIEKETKPNEDEKEKKEKKEKNVGKKRKEKKQKKEVGKGEGEKGGQMEVKEEDREKEKVGKEEERMEELKEEGKVETKKTKRKAKKKKREFKEEEEEKEYKTGKMEEKEGEKGKKEKDEDEEVEEEEMKTSATQQDLDGRMKSLCEFISFVYLYASCLFMQ